LEIVVLSLRRERVIRDLATLVELAACELDIDFGHLGSTTFRSERLRKGFEPDSAFHFARVNDPDEDTPPDLVIDVEVSTPALNRFPICAGWCAGSVALQGRARDFPPAGGRRIRGSAVEFDATPAHRGGNHRHIKGKLSDARPRVDAPCF
jgi:hypothetical protein